MLLVKWNLKIKITYKKKLKFYLNKNLIKYINILVYIINIYKFKNQIVKIFRDISDYKLYKTFDWQFKKLI